MDSMLLVTLNKKDILVDSLANEAFGETEIGGTIGFGSNNIQSEFTDISMNMIMPDDFMI